MDVITTHINADFDAVGSMIAAKKLYPDALLVLPGGGDKSTRDFFIQTSLYSLDLEPLRSIDQEKVTRLIIVDTRQRDRIGNLASIVDKPDVTVHVYDHHPDNDNDIKGEIEVIDKTGSCVAIMTRILQEKNILINDAEATVMALGIYEDTGSLTFSSTTPQDLHAAAYLLEKGANLNTISDIMSRTLTADQVVLMADMIRNAQEINLRGTKITITEASLNEYEDDLAVCVQRLKDTLNIEVLFALIRIADKVFLIARSSNKNVDVSKVAQHFGGGGHPYAAAAPVKDMTLVQARETLKGFLLSAIRKPVIASEIMSYPVKTIDRNVAISEARVLMTRYNVNVLLTMDHEKPTGLITRQVMERAALLGLEDNLVSEFETGDLIYAQHDTSFSELYEMVVALKQRLVPVLDGDQLIGVVTRTDILNNLLDENAAGQGVQSDNKENSRPAHVRDLAGLLKERLPEPLLDACRLIGKQAEELGMTAFLVGGFVRDLILRRQNLDLDIVVEGNGIELARAAAKNLDGRISPHEEFKTAVLVLPDNTKIDFATARIEYYEQPAALPIVESSSIKLDLYRRDFSINTLVISINPDRFGEMIDFFGAYQDLKDGHIRVLHNLSFIEDPTRILRAVRFEQRFGFTIGRHTLKLLKNALKSGFLKRVDGKRLLSELALLFEEEEPQQILKRLRNLDALKNFHPQLRLDGKQEALIDELADVLAWYDLLYLDEQVDVHRAWLFGLIGQMRQKAAQELLERLEIQANIAQNILDEKKKSEEALYRLSKNQNPTSSQVYRICENVSTEGLLCVMAKATNNTIRRFVSQYLIHYKYCRTEISGNDLRNFGIPQGPIYTEILDAVLNARLDGKVKSRAGRAVFYSGKFYK